MVTMFSTSKGNFKSIVWLFLLVLLLSACSNETNDILAPQVNTPISETATQSEIPDTPTPAPTPQPVAAVVNDEGIPLKLFENEVTRYLTAQEALGKPVDDEALARELVLDELINQVLLAQAARDAGVTITDEEVQARLDALSGEVDLGAWMAQWGYSEEDLFESLQFQMLASHQRDRIADSVPEILEQVELRQVLAYTIEGAERALLSLNSGASFEQVAVEYDRRNTGGYLGWIPRGYLLFPIIEEAVFDLPVGSYTDIIETDVGYHIVMVMAREERPLSNDARLALQRNAVVNWLADQRKNSTLVILINENE